jgi:uncharacterized protein (TIGR02598 family)
MKTFRNSRAGFSLIEVTIALGIAAFCLITVFALLPLGLNSNQNSFEQTAAAGIATAIAADLHGTPVVSAGSGPGLSSTTSRFQIEIPQAGQNTSAGNSSTPYQTIFFTRDGSPWLATGQTNPVGQQAMATSSPPRYRATITFQPEDTLAQNPSGLNGVVTPRNKMFKVWILITWPALSDPTPTKFPGNFSGSYEAATALDCN